MPFASSTDDEAYESDLRANPLQEGEDDEGSQGEVLLLEPWPNKFTLIGTQS